MRKWLSPLGWSVTAIAVKEKATIGEQDIAGQCYRCGRIALLE
jgi:hypothetical protein